MNARQLAKLGVPEACVKDAIQAIQSIAREGTLKNKDIKIQIASLCGSPSDFVDDAHFGGLAKAILEDQQAAPLEPISYETWGTEIESQAHAQMNQACHVPSAVGAALMPDAHMGYGLPIGGVLATENAVIPYAVGVDIACRMKLSVLDLPVESMQNQKERYEDALESQTKFGVGVKQKRKSPHEVMDRDWNVTRITREKKDTAWDQLGTSGSGNHFVEFGLLDLPESDQELGLEAGQYVALLSHSGSRGAGAAVCSTYSAIARARLPKKYSELAYLSWLDLDTEAGQEYWEAMNLMGHYAAANHDVIHQRVSHRLGAEIVTGVENHHNFAWKEVHQGREVVVHRKGATPAGEGVLGVIPGSMADPAFIVRGKGNANSLNSASHGAGRRMSRRKAKDQYTWKAVRSDLAKRGITVLSAGADEVPGAYKNIEDVMDQQTDLVERVGRFDPKIVKMCGDGSRAED